jgi:hypothetical protein
MQSFFKKRSVKVSSKVDFVPFCHSVPDTEYSEFIHLWIMNRKLQFMNITLRFPAFAGMTGFRILRVSPPFLEGKTFRVSRIR